MSGWRSHGQRIVSALHELRERGQSETIGVALLTGVVVILVATVGVFLFADFGADDEEQLLANVEGEIEPNNITLSHEGGDSFDASSIRVSVTGDAAQDLQLDDDFEEADGADGQFAPGDTWTTDTTLDPLLVGEGNVLVIDESTNTVLRDLSYSNSVTADGVTLAVEDLDGEFRSDEADVTEGDVTHSLVAEFGTGEEFEVPAEFVAGTEDTEEDGSPIRETDDGLVAQLEDEDRETVTLEAEVAGDDSGVSDDVEVTVYSSEPELNVEIEGISAGPEGGEFAAQSIDDVPTGEDFEIEVTVSNEGEVAVDPDGQVDISGLGESDSLVIPELEEGQKTTATAEFGPTEDSDLPDDYGDAGEYEAEASVLGGSFGDTAEFDVQAPAYYEVEIDDLSGFPVPGGTLTAEVEVTNLGDEDGDQEIEMSGVGNVWQGNGEEATDIELDGGDPGEPGESTTTDISLDIAPTADAGSTAEFEVSSDDDSVTGSQTIVVPEFNIEIVGFEPTSEYQADNAPNTAVEGDDLEVQVEVENEIESFGIAVDLEVDSEIGDNEIVAEVSAGETDVFNVSVGEVSSVEEIETRNVEAEAEPIGSIGPIGDEDDDEQELTIWPEAEPELSDIEVAGESDDDDEFEIVAGDSGDVEVTVANEGVNVTTFDVDLDISGDGFSQSGGASTNSFLSSEIDDVNEDEDVSIDVDLSTLEPGDYDIELEIDHPDGDAETGGDLTVLEPADIFIDDLDHDDEVSIQEELEVTVEFGNNGEVGDTLELVTLSPAAGDDSGVQLAEESDQFIGDDGGEVTLETELNEDIDGIEAGEPFEFEVEIIDDEHEDNATSEIDVLGAEYTVDIENTNEPIAEGETLAVDVEIKNDGETDGEQTITLDAGFGSDSTTVDLEPDEEITETFEVETGEGDSGIYTAEVQSPSADNDDVDVEVLVFDVEITDWDETVDQGEDISVTVDVKNLGQSEHEQEIELEIDGETESTNVEVDDGETETVTLSVDSDEVSPGTHDATVQSVESVAPESEDDVTISVLAYTVEILDNQVPDEVLQGETIEVPVTVENEGETTGETTVTVSATGLGDDEQEIELGGGDSSTDDYLIETEEGDGGSYTITAEESATDNEDEVDIIVQSPEIEFEVLFGDDSEDGSTDVVGSGIATTSTGLGQALGAGTRFPAITGETVEDDQAEDEVGESTTESESASGTEATGETTSTEETARDEMTGDDLPGVEVGPDGGFWGSAGEYSWEPADNVLEIEVDIDGAGGGGGETDTTGESDPADGGNGGSVSGLFDVTEVVGDIDIHVGEGGQFGWHDSTSGSSGGSDGGLADGGDGGTDPEFSGGGGGAGATGIVDGFDEMAVAGGGGGGGAFDAFTCGTGTDSAAGGGGAPGGVGGEDDGPFGDTGDDNDGEDADGIFGVDDVGSDGGDVESVAGSNCPTGSGDSDFVFSGDGWFDSSYGEDVDTGINWGSGGDGADGCCAGSGDDGSVSIDVTGEVLLDASAPSTVSTEEQLEVSYTIENTADEVDTDTTTLFLYVNDGDPDPVDSDSVSPSAGSTETGTLLFDDVDDFDDGDDLNWEVQSFSYDLVESGETEVEGVADISLDDADAPDEISADQNLQVDYTLSNDGSADVSLDVDLYIDGNLEEINLESVSAGGTTTGTHTYDADNFNGGETLNWKIELFDPGEDWHEDSISGTTSVEEPANINLNFADAPGTISPDEDLDVEYELVNTGDESHTVDEVTLDVGSSQEDSDTGVSVSGGSSTSGTLTYSSFNFEDGDDLNWEVEINDPGEDWDGDSDSGTTNVVGEPELEVVSIDHPDEIGPDENLVVTYTVENTGTATGTDDVELQVDGEGIVDQDFSVTLDPGETESGTLVFENVGPFVEAGLVEIVEDEAEDG